MSSVFISIDPSREALREWESAERYAEACRQDWREALALEFSQANVIQAALNYAEAANAAHYKKERYEELILEALQEDMRREALMAIPS